MLVKGFNKIKISNFTVKPFYFQLVDFSLIAFTNVKKFTRPNFVQ